MVELLDDERIDSFFEEKIQIIQSRDVFSFSIDAVLLAHFANAPKRGKIVDLCAGNGAVGLFVARHSQAEIIGVEIQPRLSDMARRSYTLNPMHDRMTLLELDLKHTTQHIKKDSVDMVICNPPYFKELPTGKKNPNPYLAIARHEISATLNDVVKTSSDLLKMNGRFAMVHRPERFFEILETLIQHRLAPKRIQFVYPKKDKDANILLIEAIKDGKLEGTKFLPPLFVYDEKEHYSKELEAILHG